MCSLKPSCSTKTRDVNTTTEQVDSTLAQLVKNVAEVCTVTFSPHARFQLSGTTEDLKRCFRPSLERAINQDHESVSLATGECGFMCPQVALDIICRPACDRRRGFDPWTTRSGRPVFGQGSPIWGTVEKYSGFRQTRCASGGTANSPTLRVFACPIKQSFGNETRTIWTLFQYLPTPWSGLFTHDCSRLSPHRTQG